MQDLKETYLKMRQKTREKNELAKMIRDELANRADYKELVDELKRLREKKKSIENEVRASAFADANQIDLLKLEISAAGELMTDIALTMYANHETVEIVDEDRGVRLTPVFSVKFQKEEMEKAAAAAAQERAASHPERTFAPTAA